MRRTQWLWVVLLTSSFLHSAKVAASTRVAVMAHDPLGRGHLLARGVAERLRARGVDAVPVEAPFEQSPSREDVAARGVGASRLVVLDLRTQSNRKAFLSPNPNGLRPGTPEHPYDPNIAIGPFMVGHTMAPAGTPQGSFDAFSEEDALYVRVPQLPYAAGQRPTEQRVMVQTETHLVARAVGSSQAEVDETLSIGAQTSWRKDLTGGTEVGEQKTHHMWNLVLGQIADRSVALVARAG